jgi:hypothetical protein
MLLDAGLNFVRGDSLSVVGGYADVWDLVHVGTGAAKTRNV